MDVLRIVAAVILPPLGVFLTVGFGGHFWLNILLTLLIHPRHYPRGLDNS